jgi:hypothetical protein
MAYFSNGSEGSSYQERYCTRCVHDLQQDCPVWGLHLAFNYDQIKDGKRTGTVHDFLSSLIPDTEDGLHQDECRMFHEATAEELSAVKKAANRLAGVDRPADWIAEWMAKRQLVEVSK